MMLFLKNNIVQLRDLYLNYSGGFSGYYGYGDYDHSHHFHPNSHSHHLRLLLFSLILSQNHYQLHVDPY